MCYKIPLFWSSVFDLPFLEGGSPTPGSAPEDDGVNLDIYLLQTPRNDCSALALIQLFVCCFTCNEHKSINTPLTSDIHCKNGLYLCVYIYSIHLGNGPLRYTCYTTR